MKQTAMKFSGHELEDLARVWTKELQQEKRSPTDPNLRADLDMLIRLQGAAHVCGHWQDATIYEIPWAVAVLRKALADADRLPDIERRVKQLEVELKLAKKPPAKPRPRPKKPLPAKVLPHSAPAKLPPVVPHAHEKPVPVMAGPGEDQ